jgi:hypothetical protein
LHGFTELLDSIAMVVPTATAQATSAQYMQLTTVARCSG